MSSTSQKTIVGAFVLVGMALFVTGIILLGGGQLFSNSLKYVLYFDGSVSGLSIGAPVVFRGVPMGNVTQISLVANPRDSNITIPVTIRIDDHSFIRSDGTSVSENIQSQIIHKMVEHGLRARLTLGSLITGQYKVELDFFPNTPVNFRSNDPYSEIPTVPSPIDTLQRTLAKLPIESMAQSISAILTNLTEALSQGQLKQGLENFTAAFAEVRDLLASSKLKTSIEQTLANVDDATALIARDLPNTMASLQKALDSIAKASDQISRVSASAGTALAKDSPTMNDLRSALREAAAAARSLRNFAEMLERNPEALLRGRQGTR